MSFVFRNGQIAAVASASGEEEIKQQTVEKSSRRQRGNSLCKSFRLRMAIRATCAAPCTEALKKT